MGFKRLFHEGPSIDETKVYMPTTDIISKAPDLQSATARCGVCGTSDQVSGRPGTVLHAFICRNKACQTVSAANDGLGFTFQGRN
jgi:hypothetical protein